MNAEAIAKALGGRKAGGVWMARCPAHDDCAPSLTIADARDGKVLVRCHAGCDQRDVSPRFARAAIGQIQAGALADSCARLVVNHRLKPIATP
jgi:putative DNA primase/helicase